MYEYPAISPLAALVSGFFVSFTSGTSPVPMWIISFTGVAETVFPISSDSISSAPLYVFLTVMVATPSLPACLTSFVPFGRASVSTVSVSNGIFVVSVKTTSLIVESLFQDFC